MTNLKLTYDLLYLRIIIILTFLLYIIIIIYGFL